MGTLEKNGTPSDITGMPGHRQDPEAAGASSSARAVFERMGMGERGSGGVWQLRADTDLSAYRIRETAEQSLLRQARKEQLTRRAEIYTALYRPLFKPNR